MNNKKMYSIANLIKNGVTIENPELKSNILNTYFLNISTVTNPDDCAPHFKKTPKYDTLFKH